MPRRMRAREIAIVTAGLAVLCAVAYGPHVFDGGFYWDDWQLAARARFPPLHSPDYAGPIDLVLLGYRPVLALLLPATHAVLGPHPAAHILFGLALNVATMACFFAFLRELDVPALPAGLMACLALIFPWSDSMRLWSTAAINTVGVILYLLGTIAALHGVRAGDPRRRRNLAILGVVLIVLGVLTYEVAAAAALLSVFLYAREIPWRAAVRRWAIDVVAVVAAAAWVAIHTPRTMEPLGRMIDHGVDIVGESARLESLAAAPFGSPPRGWCLVPRLCSWRSPWRCGRALAGRTLARSARPVAGDHGRGAIGVLAELRAARPRRRPLPPPRSRRHQPHQPAGRAALLRAGRGAAMLVGLLALGRGPRRARAPVALATCLTAVWARAGCTARSTTGASGIAPPHARSWCSMRSSEASRATCRRAASRTCSERPSTSRRRSRCSRSRGTSRAPRACASTSATWRLCDRPRGFIACRPDRVEPLGSAYDNGTRLLREGLLRGCADVAGGPHRLQGHLRAPARADLARLPLRACPSCPRSRPSAATWRPAWRGAR